VNNADLYTSEEILKLECQVLLDGWVFSGYHINDIPLGGAKRVDWNGESVILTRPSQDEVCTFLNNCLHRGTRFFSSEQDVAHGRVTCFYHRWSYDLLGNLKHAPYCQFDKKDLKLQKISNFVWNGFIFISFIDHNPQNIAVRFEIADRWLSQFKLDSFVKRIEKRCTMMCNWKIFIQNCSEEYHVPMIHPQFYSRTGSKWGKNGISSQWDFSKDLNVDLDKLFHFGDWIDFLPYYKESKSLTLSGKKYSEELPYLCHFFIFPATVITICGDYCNIEIIDPIAVDRTDIINFIYLNEKVNEKDVMDLFDITMSQDTQACEAAQQGNSSLLFQENIWTSLDACLVNFHDKVMERRNLLQAASARAPLRGGLQCGRGKTAVASRMSETEG
jgi:phenylpropionate dioxygenase-like ring-hydroxylating dioxygenase large terminal subunit